MQARGGARKSLGVIFDIRSKPASQVSFVSEWWMTVYVTSSTN